MGAGRARSGIGDVVKKSTVGREWRPLVKQLERLGYRVVNGSDHGRLVDSEGHFISSVPRTNSCPRAVKNWRAQLAGAAAPEGDTRLAQQPKPVLQS